MTKFASRPWKIVGSLANSIHLERWGSADRWLGVLFHHITDKHRWQPDDPLVCGLNVDLPVQAFEKRVRWLKERYELVSLDAVLQPSGSSRNSKPKTLICFDDGYASVFHLAAPILRSMNIPFALFINPRFIGNKILPVDNIVAYIANVHGTAPLEEVAGINMGSPHAFIGTYLSQIPPERRRSLVEDIASKLQIDTVGLAQRRCLFMEESQLRELADSGVEIGNHTSDHVHCRSLDSDTAQIQIEDSARDVARMAGRRVRAFAYPYGSLTDATPIARLAVKNSGHDCAFVVHNRTNTDRTHPFSLFRVDLGELDDSRAALELEVLPRIRSLVARLRP